MEPTVKSSDEAKEASAEHKSKKIVLRIMKPPESGGLEPAVDNAAKDAAVHKRPRYLEFANGEASFVQQRKRSAGQGIFMVVNNLSNASVDDHLGTEQARRKGRI